MQDIERVDRCRVCGRDDWLDIISFGSAPLANGLLDPAADDADEQAYPLDVALCRECGLMSLRHIVNPEKLFRYFVWVSSDSALMTRHRQRVFGWCAEKSGMAAGDLVVEMGSNVGTQLALFQERGLRTVGVDPARNLARIANDRGVETVADFFGPEVTASIRETHGAAKLVMGHQCFAHIDDVHNVLDGVDRVLAPDGTLVIEVPYVLDLLDENQFDTIYHEHLSYYSLTTLSRLFASHGLPVVDVERADVHGGSIVVFAAREGSGRRPSARVADLLALEERRGLTTARPYLEFADRTRRTIDAIGDVVRGLAAEGKRIAGYGAPSKGSTLLQMCGLTPAEVQFCSDTTSFKQGKLLPGSRIPIRSPEQARAQAPDYYLLLAWNYAEEIIAKEQAFLDAGGRFIVPIPQPRIVDSALTASA
ncbi:class I SAM-dependent methyltransferase [Actinosynnema sp. CS-041913]|uniref:class I SAM-dependent methyltransferase n=1 Tax=Actinosynnema sp. CS-041913 TaxID=3239917 RepID=UPI003D916CB1